MIVRFLFATVFAAAVSVALWAGASALIEPAPFMDEAPSVVQTSQVQLCVDCEDDLWTVPPPPPPCTIYTCTPPPVPSEYASNPASPLVMVPPRDFEQCTLPGVVTVRIVVGPEGGRGIVTVIDSTDPCLNRPSVAAADKWLFGPSESQLPRVVTHTFTYE